MPVITGYNLLKKYMAHVLDCEGTTFVDTARHSDVIFSEVERDILEGIECEVLEERRAEIAPLPAPPMLEQYSVDGEQWWEMPLLSMTGKDGAVIVEWYMGGDYSEVIYKSHAETGDPMYLRYGDSYMLAFVKYGPTFEGGQAILYRMSVELEVAALAD